MTTDSSMAFPTLTNDRILKVLKGHAVDKTPAWIMRQAGRYLPEFRAVRQKHDFFNVCRQPELACEVTLQPIQRFEGLFDASIIFSDILVIPQALGMVVEMLPAKGPHFLEPLVSPEDLQRLDEHVSISQALNYVFEAITLTRKSLNGQVPLFGFAGAPWTIMAYMIEGGGSKTFQKSKTWLYKYPEASHKLLGIITRATVDYLFGQIKAGAQMLQVFESSAGELFPAAFDKFSLPYLAQIARDVRLKCEEAQIACVPMIVFARGAHASLEKVVGLGYEGIGLDWTMDVVESKRRIRNAMKRLGLSYLSVQGNLDPTLLFAPPELLREEADKMIRSFLVEEDGSMCSDIGYICNLGHGILPEVIPDNVRVFLEQVGATSKEIVNGPGIRRCSLYAGLIECINGTFVNQEEGDSISLKQETYHAPSTTYSTTPRRVCGPHLEKNVHFVDRPMWNSLSSEELSSKREDWRAFLSDPLLSNYPADKFAGKGILYLTHGKTFNRTLASIRLLRNQNCTLPVETWYITGELTPEQIVLLTSIQGVSPKDIKVEQLNYPSLEAFHLHNVKSSNNYQVKSLVLALSSFEEMLYLDSDNMPLTNPEFLFQSAEYLETGAFFWRDFWKFPSDNPLWQITQTPCEDEWEQESGQLLINKRKSWKPLVMSMFFQRDHEFYFQIILGDKDTFRFAWKVTGTKYHMSNHHVGIAGRIIGGKFCGHTMLQPGPSGVFIFAHTTVLKHSYEIRLGNTWESVQYFKQAEDLEPFEIDQDRLSYLVHYPTTLEFRSPEEQLDDGVIYSNPCLALGTQPTRVETTKSVVSAMGLHRAVDNFEIVTQNFSDYENGLLSSFEKEYYGFGGVGSSKKTGTCGNGRVGNGICESGTDECCSAFGWCGNSDNHCGVGCKGGDCFKNRVVPDHLPKNFNFCGGGKIGFGKCRNSEVECCSRFGWCGSSTEFCEPKTCVSGPCMS